MSQLLLQFAGSKYTPKIGLSEVLELFVPEMYSTPNDQLGKRKA
jgi:hypothetical protein